MENNNNLTNNNSEVYPLNLSAIEANVRTYQSNGNAPNKSPIQSIYDLPAQEGFEILRPTVKARKTFGTLPAHLLAPNTTIQNSTTNRMLNQSTKGGASIGEPLAYVDSKAPVPSAPAGSNLLVSNGLITRPAIGGFVPSVMKGVVDGGFYMTPLAVMAASRMLSRKRGGGKKEDWARNREFAKGELAKYGKPSAANVNKLAALARKNQAAARQFMYNFKAKKAEQELKKAAKKPRRKAAISPTRKMPRALPMFNNSIPKPRTKKVVRIVSPPRYPMSQAAIYREAEENSKRAMANYAIQTRRKTTNKQQAWRTLMANAKMNLSQFGKPSIVNMTKYASLKRQGIPMNTFISDFQTRKQQKATPMQPKTRIQEQQPITAVTKRNKYRENFAAAKAELAQYGRPTGPNIAKFVTLKRRGNNVTQYMTNFRTRARNAAVKQK